MTFFIHHVYGSHSNTRMVMEVVRHASSPSSNRQGSIVIWVAAYLDGKDRHRHRQTQSAFLATLGLKGKESTEEKEERKKREPNPNRTKALSPLLLFIVLAFPLITKHKGNFREHAHNPLTLQHNQKHIHIHTRYY